MHIRERAEVLDQIAAFQRVYRRYAPSCVTSFVTIPIHVIDIACLGVDNGLVQPWNHLPRRLINGIAKERVVLKEVRHPTMKIEQEMDIGRFFLRFLHRKLCILCPSLPALKIFLLTSKKSIDSDPVRVHNSPHKCWREILGWHVY